MPHKHNDWSLLGGFGFTEDDLEYDRNGVYETIAAFYADGGTTPMLLSGSFGVGLSAWVIINKEILPYVGPGFPPPLTVGMAYYIVVSESSSPVAYQDGSTHNSINISRIAGLVAASISTPPAGGVLMADFIPFQKIFGEKARSTWQNINGSTAQFDFNIDFKKNILINTLQIKGAITVKSTVSTSNYYYVIGTIPAEFRPSTVVPFIGSYRYHATSLKDSTSTDFIDQTNGEIRPDGTILIGLRKPDSSLTTYPLTFNAIVPLD